MRNRRVNGWLAGLAATAAAAAFVHLRSRKAERENPPSGKFIDVAGTRVHYVERGRGPALILLHGNASAGADFLIGPLVAIAAARYRVFVFDRPGYGYSDGIRGCDTSPEAQARLIGIALRRLGIKRAVVLGHSLGALVAIAMALEFPHVVRGLVLESGFLYPQPRIDMALLSQAATPVFGALMRHTLLPLLVRAAWPLVVAQLFAPAPVPAYFWRLPPWLLLRPAQMWTSAMELGLAGSFARRLAARYNTLRMPIVILAGGGDRLVEHEAHSSRLHAHLPHAKCRVFEGMGHMIHHTDPRAVLQALDEVSARRRSLPHAGIHMRSRRKRVHGQPGASNNAQRVARRANSP